MAERKAKDPETPQEFLLLSPKLQADRVTKVYIEKCTNTQLFIFSPKANRKVLCSQYHAIKRFLMKNQESLVLLYSYLYAIEGEPMDLSMLFQRAQEYNQKLKLEGDKEKAKEVSGVETYEDYGSILGRMMES